MSCPGALWSKWKPVTPPIGLRIGANGKALISGHPTYCPTPVLVDLHGSVGGPAMLKIWFVGPGFKMEFQHPEFGVIRTSRVRSVRELKSEVPS